MTIAEHCTMHEKLTNVKTKRNGKLLKEAEKLLTDNENVLYAVLFVETGCNKVLVVTNKKVYTCENAITGFKTETLNLKDITSIDKIKSSFKVLQLSTGGLIIKGITQTITIKTLSTKAKSILDDIERITYKAKEDRFDTYIKELIKGQLDIDINKIELLVTKKTRIKEVNEFNYFLFKYKRKTYELLDGNLCIVDNK